MAGADTLLYKVKVLLKRYIPGLAVNANRVPKDIWEQQYSDDTWDYLESEDERAHYEVIADFYRKYADGHTVIDIGCGKGVLFKYMSEYTALEGKGYTGIDISENAISAAKQRFPNVDFRTVDYQYESVAAKYGVVIFNETLYYFTQPVETLEKCFSENLDAGGKVIISMCDYERHNNIWPLIESRFNVLDAREVANDKGQLWRIKIISAK